VETTADSPRELDRFELVLLKRPDSAPPMTDEEIDRLQDLHIAHLVQQTDAGDIRLAGPFDEQRDPTLRGMSLYHTGSLERARSLASSDPAVIAGRLEIDVMYFYCPKGQL
jgi:uncharacterized protein